jgi:tRNA-Thr(GGU) m(6)t(6)A37 methyltransferase TsaA
LKFEIQPIGVVHSPFINKNDAPPQVSYSSNTKATVEIYPDYVDGINGFERFESIIIISYLHKSQNYSLMTIPRTDNKLRGVFSTKSPHRPNPIAISITRLLEIKNNIIYIQGIDLINETPVLDIKPYIEEI